MRIVQAQHQGDQGQSQCFSRRNKALSFQASFVCVKGGCHLSNLAQVLVFYILAQKLVFCLLHTGFFNQQPCMIAASANLNWLYSLSLDMKNNEGFISVHRHKSPCVLWCVSPSLVHVSPPQAPFRPVFSVSWVCNVLIRIPKARMLCIAVQGHLP
jgi:hypothetical protein